MNADVSGSAGPERAPGRMGAPVGAPRGRANDQRTRMLRAAEQSLYSAPTGTLDAAKVCAIAGLPRHTLDETFGRNGLQLAVFDDIATRVAVAIGAARSAQGSWLEGVRAALIELLRLFDQAPGVARFLLVNSLAGDSALLVRRERALELLAGSLREGSPPLEAELLPAAFGGEAVVGAVIAILHGRLIVDPVPPLLPLCNSLMSVIVLPYLGVEAARAELARTTPAPSLPERDMPLRELGLAGKAVAHQGPRAVR